MPSLRGEAQASLPFAGPGSFCPGPGDLPSQHQVPDEAGAEDGQVLSCKTGHERGASFAASLRGLDLSIDKARGRVLILAVPSLWYRA